MPENWFNSGGSIFKNEKVLDPDYVPDSVVHRDSEMKTIASWISPLTHGRRPVNGLIYAPAGLGKTTCVKFLLQKLNEETNNIASSYINCWKVRSRYSILSDIARQMNIILTKRGYTSDEIWELISNKLNQMRGLVVVLDEAEKLMLKDGQEVLYDLTRTDKVCLLLVAQTTEFVSLLDRKSASALNFMDQEFSQYTIDQIKDIIKVRADMAFLEKISPDVINSCSRVAYEFGSDIRVGLECMRYAGRIAEQGKEKINVNHVQMARKNIGTAKVKSLIGNLSEQEKEILKAIVKLRPDGPIYTGVLLQNLEKDGVDLSRTMVMEYLRRLKQFGLIRTQVKMIDTDTGGRSTVIEPLSCLKELL